MPLLFQQPDQTAVGEFVDALIYIVDSGLLHGHSLFFCDCGVWVDSEHKGIEDIDEILNSGTGICLDYAAVMTGMLRSQRIPTRLEVGYAQDAYHAWISIYTEETGWLNGIIEFNGNV